MQLLHCPICKQQFDAEKSTTMPFCSDRCKRIDLMRWLDERYTLPIERETNPHAEHLHGEEEIQ